MHLLKRNLFIKKFINQKFVGALCQGALIYVTPARLISRMLPAPQKGPSNPLYRHHHSPTPKANHSSPLTKISFTSFKIFYINGII